ncbi:hypothetical protein Zmor_017547 [Zophobas morio]|uniref:Uncharacterized protein n=1 Tax=Zophobas morio TaxID=2755281 RepID=A0AA38I8Z1_9CUCU|nr:hypothetical protein Zmor_017547 [Zophobas morio]
MSDSTAFRHMYEELKVIHRNLGKDSSARRQDPKAIRSKVNKINKLNADFKDIRDNFNKHEHNDALKKEVKEYVELILKFFDLINRILESRLKEVADLREITDVNDSDLELDSLEIINNNLRVKMGEKFSLRTAASLLPLMDGTEDATKRLIDAIELYDTLLDADSKQLLITYVLKTRLTQSAKIRLRSTYTNCIELIADLRKYFLTKKSAAILSVQLNSARQNNNTIDEFGKTIEELVTELTIAQANGDQQVLDVLRLANEKIAINVFSNGLRNTELRTIVKARNYSKLSDAIRGALDEQPSTSLSQQIFNMRINNQFRRNYGNRGNFNSNRSHFQPNSRRNYNHSNSFVNNNQRAQSNTNRGNSSTYSNGNYRGSFRGNRGERVNYRGNQLSNRSNRGQRISNNQLGRYDGRPRVYVAENREEQATEEENSFFRAN